jgi:5-(carboxyamino)imidazole ribonucleotide synthase
LKLVPKKMLAMLGGGQLGRYFVMAAHKMGYKVTVLDPDPESPAGRVADIHLNYAYDNKEALDKIIQTCEAVSTEFENIPAESLDYLNKKIQVHPNANAVRIVQNRIREKTFLRENAIPVGLFYVIQSIEDFNEISQECFPGILKIAEFGYDGKGQKRVNDIEGALKAFAEFNHKPCVLEKQIQLDKEVSVILARSVNGEIKTHPVAENIHVNGILDTTIAPANIDHLTKKNVTDLAKMIALKLNYIGVMAVEFFLSGKQIFVNEIAPRPHNSGHYTIDACYSSQFDQQVRALVEMPLGNPDQHSNAIMINLLGDVWEEPKLHEPNWESILEEPNLNLHLYGKEHPRKSRKMGHITFVTDGSLTHDHVEHLQNIKKRL